MSYEYLVQFYIALTMSHLITTAFWVTLNSRKITNIQETITTSNSLKDTTDKIQKIHTQNTE